MPPVFTKFICTWDYIKYYREHLLPACLYNDEHTAHNSRQLKMLRTKKPGNKIKTLKMKPSYERNLYVNYLKLLLVPCLKFCSAKITD